MTPTATSLLWLAFWYVIAIACYRIIIQGGY